MENGWNFIGNEQASEASSVTIRGYIMNLFAVCDHSNQVKPVLPLGHGDPAVYPVFRTAIEAEDAVVDAVRYAKYNGYSFSAGIDPARQAVADYLNRKLTQKLTLNDVFLAVGCNQAIELLIQVLWRPNANILLPRPGFPHYEARAVYNKLEVRKYDLLPEKEWEIDYEGIEALADKNTVAIVIINPNNPCGNVYTADQLKKVAEIAKKHGMMVISDEVYDNIIYGPNPFVPMATFSSIAPVITLGAISKGWIVPGWRIGWIAAHDHEEVLVKSGVIKSLKDHLDISPDPTTFLQAALSQIFENTKQEFFDRKSAILKANVDYSCERLLEIPAVVVIRKPESCTYMLAKLNLSLLEGVKDDLDFCEQLAREENLVFLPGTALGLKDWVRITIGVEHSMLEDAFDRLKTFYQRHSK